MFLEHPLPERLAENRPVVLDPEAIGENRALSIGRRRGDAVDHAVGKRHGFANERSEAGIDEVGEPRDRVARYMTVPRNVVARHDREGHLPPVATTLQGRENDAEYAPRRLHVRSVVNNLRMIGIERACGRIDAVPALRDSQRHDPQVRVVEQIDDRAAIFTDRHKVHHGAADPGGIRFRFEFHDGCQPVLRSESVANSLVVGSHAGADQRPLVVFAGIEEIVEVNRLMRAVKISDADVENTGTKHPPVVGRAANGRVEGGQRSQAERLGHGCTDLARDRLRHRKAGCDCRQGDFSSSSFRHRR